MALTAEQAQNIAQMRLRMVTNMKAGKPAESGIDKDELKATLELIRQDRSLGDATGSKAKAKAPQIPIDLGEFMKGGKG